MTHPELMTAVEQSQARFVAGVQALSEEQARGPSALPGWTRGHVISHLCRNADALNRIAVGVLAGAPAQMYPGGPDARNAAIDEGADRPVELMVADLRFAGARLVDSLRSIDPSMLDTPVQWRRPITARDLPALRWSELEIHHLDLDVGYTVADWPASYVESTLATQLGRLADTAPDVAIPDLPPAELLAWLVGRPTQDGLPALPSWPY